MSLIQLCILSVAGLSFIGVSKWTLLPFLNKWFKDRPLVGANCFYGLLSAVFLPLVWCVLSLQSAIVMPFSLSVVFLLAAIGVVILSFFDKQSCVYWIMLWALCLLGTFVLPSDVSFVARSFGGVFYCFIASFLWLAFIALMMLVNRVPLFSFVAFSSLFVGAVFLTSDFFKTIPDYFFLPSVVSLLLFLCITYSLKQYRVLSWGRSTVFLFGYFIGYVGLYLAAIGEAVYLPIFIGYELFEVLFALSLNVYLFRKIYPIQVPFLIERAFMTGVLPNKIIQKVFIICLVLVFLATLCIHVNGDFIFLAYGFWALISYSVYLSFSSWDKPKVRFWNLFSDVKNGVHGLKTELTNLPLKQTEKEQGEDIVGSFDSQKTKVSSQRGIKKNTASKTASKEGEVKRKSSAKGRKKSTVKKHRE